MGCIKSTEYVEGETVLVSGEGIQGVYNSKEECEDDCGICCKWICPTLSGPVSKDLLQLGIYTIDDLLPTGNWDPYLNSYSATANCNGENAVFVSQIPTGTWYVQDGEAVPIPEFPTLLQVAYNTYVFNVGYPRTSDNWLIGYSAKKGYDTQKICDNGVVQVVIEEFGTFEARYFECISGEILDVTEDALSTFDIVFFNTGENANPPGIEDPGRFTENIVENNPVIGTNINYSYHEYVECADDGSTTAVTQTGYYSVNSPPVGAPCLCTNYEAPETTIAITTGPNTTEEPEPTGNSCYDFRNFSSDISGCDINWPSGDLITYECDPDMNQSGCIYGGVDSPTGLAIGTWFSGISCSMADAYGGCSGLINM